jgi:hypothetical protein
VAITGQDVFIEQPEILLAPIRPGVSLEMLESDMPGDHATPGIEAALFVFLKRTGTRQIALRFGEALFESLERLVIDFALSRHFESSPFESLES